MLLALDNRGNPVARRFNKTARACLLLGLVAGLLGVSVFIFQIRKPATSIEALRSELALRDGRLYRNDDFQPFTGELIEKYDTGMRKSRSQVAQGLLNGFSEGWSTNGQLVVREFFKDGVSHGLRTKWYRDGKKMSETTISNGQHHGTFRRWHENGQLAEQIEMKQGDPDGLSLAYYPSGFLKAQAHSQRGSVMERKSWNDGDLRQLP
jgi:antitoxin component YwqK of YwqJK toxin-antitoxin module